MFWFHMGGEPTKWAFTAHVSILFYFLLFFPLSLNEAQKKKIRDTSSNRSKQYKANQRIFVHRQSQLNFNKPLVKCTIYLIDNAAIEYPRQNTKAKM